MSSTKPRHNHIVSTRRAFTLVEIMIVVTIIGILAAAAMANYSYAREKSRQTSCIGNLRQFDSAKEQYAMMHGLNDGDTVTTDEVFPLLLKGTPATCPSGGTYTLQPIGTAPTCSIVGNYPHVLP